jgi:nucleoside-diphosphate-sugar epimerase
MKVFFTGSEGGVGQEAVPALERAGHHVITSSRKPSDRPGHIQADVRDFEAMRRGVEGCDAVIHNGAASSDLPEQPGEVLSINVQGTLAVFAAAREAGVKQFVYHSSVNALGFPRDVAPLSDAMAPEPISDYQVSKYLAEEALERLGAVCGITTVCLRSCWIGIPRVTKWWRELEPDQLDALHCESMWAHVSVDDVIDAMHRALTYRRRKHLACLLAADDRVGSRPTAELIRRWKPEMTIAEGWLDSPDKGLIDCSLAKQELGWSPAGRWASIRREGE